VCIQVPCVYLLSPSPSAVIGTIIVISSDTSSIGDEPSPSYWRTHDFLPMWPWKYVFPDFFSSWRSLKGWQKCVPDIGKHLEEVKICCRYLILALVWSMSGHTVTPTPANRWKNFVGPLTGWGIFMIFSANCNLKEDQLIDYHFPFLLVCGGQYI
jgi:hypothetical protein